MLFVEEESNSKIAYLFFGIFSRRDEVDSFEVPKVDIPAKNVDVKELPRTSVVAPLASPKLARPSHLADIFLPLVSVKASICA